MADGSIWGTVPAWLTTMLAGAGGSIAYRNFRVDRQDRRQKYANEISAWVEVMPEAWPGSSGGEVGQLAVRIRNGSGSPAPMTVVSIVFQGMKGTVEMMVLPPTDEPLKLRLPVGIDLALRQWQVRRATSMPDVQFFSNPFLLPEMLELELSFFDVTGQAWQRDHFGALTSSEMPQWYVTLRRLRLRSQTWWPRLKLFARVVLRLQRPDNH